MNFINNMKIGLRLNVILSLVMVVIITTFGIYTLNNQKKKIIEDTDLRMFEQVEDLSRIIEMQTEDNQKNARKALDVATTLLESYGGINVINNENGISWQLNGKNIFENYDYVDEIKGLTSADVSIFEKRPEGFKRITTTIISNSGKREIGTVVSTSSPVSQAVNSGQNYYGRAVVIDEWNLTGYSPIWNNGQIIGMIGVGIKEKDLQGLRKIFKEKKYFDSGYPFMIDNQGNFIIHPTKEGENSSESEFFQQLVSSNSNKGKTYYLWEGKQKYQYFKYVDAIESYVSVSIYEFELLGIIKQMRNAIILAIAIGVLIFVLVNTQISRTITRALNMGVDFASKIATGDLKTDMNIDQKDEIGMLANSLNTMVSKLREIVTGINLGANNVASASQQISSSTQQLSEGATEQASSTEEVSSSMEEMVSNIQQNTDNAQQTEKISINASEGIAKVSSASQESLTSIRQIAEKITIVNDIAFQTNILALNAAVEAARAGEHGKGFAVVAAEVRKLAERSKVAADEIMNLSSHSVTVTEEAGALMEEILPDIEKTAKLVQEISAASLEQNSGADQVNNAIQQLNTVTQQNAAASEEMATSSEELASQAEQLKDVVSFFKVDDNEKAFTTRRNLQEFKKKNKPVDTGKVNKQIPKADDSKGFDIKLTNDKNLDNEFESF